MSMETLMQQSIEIAIERDVLAKEVELLRQQIAQYKVMVEALKQSNETLNAVVRQQNAPFGLPIPPTVDMDLSRCMICGEPGGHGNLSCPKMTPRC